MTFTMCLMAVGIVAVIFYAIHSGRDVRAGLKLFGLSAFFEASDRKSAAKPIKQRDRKLLK